MPEQYNPHQQTSQPNIPRQNILMQQHIQKTNWILYIITVVISFLVLLFLNGSLVLSINFLHLASFTMVYVSISIISLGVGLVTGFVINKIAKTDTSFLTGSLIVSILSAVVIFIYLFMQKRLVEQTAALGTGYLVDMFGPTPNPMIVGILILLLFNIVPLILFLRRRNTSH